MNSILKVSTDTRGASNIVHTTTTTVKKKKKKEDEGIVPSLLLIFVHNLSISYFCSSVYLCVRALLLEALHQSHLVRFLYTVNSDRILYTHIRDSFSLSSYIFLLHNAPEIYTFIHSYFPHSLPLIC